MNSKPKGFSEAIEELENLTDGAAANFKSRLKQELADLEDKIEDLKPKIEEVKERMQSEAKRTKDKVETQVRDNPWAAIGIVGLVFFILGCLFAARRKD